MLSTDTISADGQYCARTWFCGGNSRPTSAAEPAATSAEPFSGSGRFAARSRHPSVGVYDDTTRSNVDSPVFAVAECTGRNAIGPRALHHIRGHRAPGSGVVR